MTFTEMGEHEGNMLGWGAGVENESVHVCSMSAKGLEGLFFHVKVFFS